jgi:hypothetical protein
MAPQELRAVPCRQVFQAVGHDGHAEQEQTDATKN